MLNKEIKIIIENIKKIKKMEFILKLEKGIIVISGDNASGKSTLLTCIAKLVQRASLRKEFRGIYKNGCVKYISSTFGKEYIWKKNRNWYEINSKSNDMFFIGGFFESSILSGLRFEQLKNKHTLREYKNGYSASEFIKNELEFIINGENTKYFNSLKYIKLSNDVICFLEQDDCCISEYDFSTGEYFVLSILKIINTLKEKPDKLKLFIIDEIDLALHPLAQKRLFDKLKEWYEKYNLLFIIATHSLVIIEDADPNNMYYLENQNIRYPPIYPAYITSKLYKHYFYDRIILVEDILSKKFIKKIIETKMKDIQLKYNIIPIGGYENLMRHHAENNKMKYYGSAKVVAILDGDIEQDEIAQKKLKPYKSNKHFFLPFMNVEREVFDLLDDNNFLNIFEKCSSEKICNLEFIKIKKEALNEISSDKVKNVYKKFKEDISKCSDLDINSVEDKIIEYLCSNNQKNEKFIKNLKEFMESQ
ncbi:ATP-dependent nuclease [Campylobacter insulaenigrae]|uniref:ATP-dependent nuclease n=2 Tax=Campylobacter insulaenigrae TaxID=260714 RepID=UPI0021521535|nr:AAA family ATPase [Campylobacter insulaenigrae]MCR6570440.1 AAA family ATPase [Campylobacter insulaenigrae]